MTIVCLFCSKGITTRKQVDLDLLIEALKKVSCDVSREPHSWMTKVGETI